MNSSKSNIIIIIYISIIVIISWLLYFSQYGVDFTDEGYYLVWISSPYTYNISTTQFGYIYYPLYELLNGDITSLRQANILIIFFLAWICSCLFLKNNFHYLPPKNYLVLSGSFAVTSLVYFYSWLPTPSYNSLNFQALLIASIGLLLANKNYSYTSIVGWLLLGLGGWLAFMAKPTTAIGLGVCAVIYTILMDKFRIRLVLLSLFAFIALLFISALIIDGSIVLFAERLKNGLHAIDLMGGHTRNIIRLNGIHLGLKQQILIIIGTVFIFLIAYISQTSNARWNKIGKVISLLFIVFIFIFISGALPFLKKLKGMHGLLLWIIPFVSLMFFLLTNKTKKSIKLNKQQWITIVFFLLLPYLYALGTNANYWYAGSHAMIFWVLAGLVFLSSINTEKRVLSILFSLALSSQLLTVATVYASLELPYRQPHSLYKNKFEVEINTRGSKIIVSDSYGIYLKSVREKMKELKFETKTPMIDLTGQSPTTLYAIGARSTAKAWLLGSYPGSNNLAIEMLKYVSCKELSIAWLINEPNGPRKLSPTILSTFGANLYHDFDIIAEFNTPKGGGGYKKSRLQQILRPNRPNIKALMACRATREKS